jgi:hypothetical protein
VHKTVEIQCHQQIQWFWRAFDQADRARFLEFVTGAGTSKVPLQGFANLERRAEIPDQSRRQVHRSAAIGAYMVSDLAE